MSRHSLVRAATLLLLMAAPGCYKATFVGDRSLAHKATTHEEWTDHYVFGLVDEDPDHDVREWCPDGAGLVRTGGNAATGLVTIATLGIYSPRKIYVTCSEVTP